MRRLAKITFEGRKPLDYRVNEAYKSLRTNVQFSGTGVKVIDFTSCTPNEGKSSVSFNLAVSFAESGKKVIMIDADMRKSVLAGRYKVGGVEAGLAHYLSGQMTLDEVLMKTDIEGMDIIFSGPFVPNPAELLESDNFHNLVEYCREHYDYVLIDSPAGIGTGFELATCAADKVVVVTTPQVSSVHDADCVLRILRRRKDLSLFLLINSFRKQMAKDGNMLRVEDICELLRTDLLGVVLEDDSIVVSQNHGESILGHRSCSEACYRNICRRIMGEDVPVPDYLHEKRSFWKLSFKKMPETAGKH